MELEETLLKRRSIRSFKEDEVEQEKIDKLLMASMSGPSACNKMPWEFYVITNKEKLDELRKATRFSNIKAPLAIVVCGNLLRALPLHLASYWIQDCSAATENILLEATNLSLGSLWCGVTPQKNNIKKVSEVLDLPKNHVPLNIIYIGYPNEEKEERTQYEEKRVHYVK